jgi:hypothetical protein
VTPRVALAVIAWTALVPAEGSAQACLRPQPWPDCRTLIVTEAGAALPPPGPEEYYLVWEAGAMRSLSSRLALGATGFIGLAEEARGGVRVRARIQLARHVALDLSPGVELFDDRFSFETPAFAGQVSLNLTEWIAPFFEYQAGTYPFGDGTSPYPGIKAGSYAGLALGVLGAVVTGIEVIRRRIS